MSSNSTTSQPQIIGNFTIGPEIGRGSFANVYKGFDNRTKKPVAIKSVFRSRLKNQKLIENLEIEISILKNLKNPHIVCLMDCIQTDQHFHLMMEYCSLGDLSYFIRKRDQLVKTVPSINLILSKYPSPPNSHGLNKVLVVNFVKQLASALEFLRSQNLVHRDIKPQNLLLSPPCQTQDEFKSMGYSGMWDLPVLKIADFGFARFLPSTSLAETLCGSPLYMAPEILRYEKYNAKADLWSVGAVIYEMSVGKPPFRAANHVELLRKIEKAKDEISFPTSAQVSEDIVRLICGLLKAKPTERMGFNEFFNDLLIVEKNTASVMISPPNLMESSESDDIIKNIINNNSPISGATLEHSISAAKATKAAAASKNSRKEIKENAAYEKEYVVVEKRTVEVNALADELDKAGTGAVAISPSYNTPNYGYSRRYSSSTSRSSSNASNHRRPSFNERKIPISISPSNALTKALGYTSNRLFSALQQQNYSPPQPLQLTNVPEQQVATLRKTSFNAESALTHVNTTLLNNSKALKPLPQEVILEDAEVIYQLELLATMAHAISLFAEVKFSQLIPLPPSSSSTSNTASPNNDDDLQQDTLPPEMIKSISEEGVALYVKTLSLLAKAMSIASDWWSANSFKSTTSPKLNELVQWIRSRFNESLEKAEFLKLKLANAIEQLPTTTLNDGDVIVAEKLIFDRALEMSRTAAMNELKNEDLLGCELSYSTSIWMLEALLNYESIENNEKLDGEDKKTVQLFITSIGNRLKILRTKIEKQGIRN